MESLKNRVYSETGPAVTGISANLSCNVIPVKTGIQQFQYILDTVFRRYDDFGAFYEHIRP